MVDAAIDAGVTLFDSADIYGGGGSEEMLGDVLGPGATRSCWPRSSATPGWTWGTEPRPGPRAAGPTSAARSSSAEAAPHRLSRPVPAAYAGPVTPVGETLHALSELVAEGKVRYLGHSNFSGWQIAEAAHLARETGTEAFVSAQNHWSLLERQAEAEVVPAARAFGLGVLPYYPLANGLLTGKVRRGQAPPPGSRLASREAYITGPKLDRVEALTRWAAEHGVSLLDVAIGGLAAQPGCASVIAGATSPDQVKANAAAADWIPAQDTLSELDQLVPPPDPES